MPSFSPNRSGTPFQQTDGNKCSSQTGNLMPTTEMEESTSKWLSQVGSTTHSNSSLTHTALPSVPLWTRDVHRAVQKPELRSPSFFMPQEKAGSEMVSILLKEKLVCLLGSCQPTCCLLLFLPMTPQNCSSSCYFFSCTSCRLRS